ncbi:MAG: TRAP transporter small permease [Candidatus Competibacterales bacterium]
MLLTAANVGSYLLDELARSLGGAVSAIAGYEEAVILALGVAAPMFLPYCQSQRGHVAVDFLVQRLPLGLQAALDALSLGLTTALALFLSYWLFQGMVESRDLGVVMGILGWPQWPFYWPGIVSLALWALVAGLQLSCLVATHPGEPVAGG